MGTDVIDRELVDELQGVMSGLVAIAVDHSKCLACHCYREVAQEAVGTLSLVSGHDVLVEGGVPAGFDETAARLRVLLASSEGTHG